MGALYMLESMAFMYYALNADTMTRAEIYKDLVNIIRDTEESGILEQDSSLIQKEYAMSAPKITENRKFEAKETGKKYLDEMSKMVFATSINDPDFEDKMAAFSSTFIILGYVVAFPKESLPVLSKTQEHMASLIASYRVVQQILHPEQK